MKILIILAILVVAYLVYRGLTLAPVVEKPAEIVKPVEKVKPASRKTTLEIAAGIVVLGALLISAAFLM